MGLKKHAGGTLAARLGAPWREILVLGHEGATGILPKLDGMSDETAGIRVGVVSVAESEAVIAAMIGTVVMTRAIAATTVEMIDVMTAATIVRTIVGTIVAMIDEVTAIETKNEIEMA